MMAALWHTVVVVGNIPQTAVTQVPLRLVAPLYPFHSLHNIREKVIALRLGIHDVYQGLIHLVLPPWPKAEVKHFLLQLISGEVHEQ